MNLLGSRKLIYNALIFFLGLAIVFVGFSKDIKDIFAYIAGYIFFVVDVYLIALIMKGLVTQNKSYTKKKWMILFLLKFGVVLLFLYVALIAFQFNPIFLFAGLISALMFAVFSTLKKESFN